MNYSKVELRFSKKHDMHFLVFEGSATLDAETQTITRRKEFVWQNEEEFEIFKEALGL